MELVAGTAGPQPSLPGSALSDLLLLHLRRCQQEQHAELSLFYFYFFLWLSSVKFWLCLGRGLSLRASSSVSQPVTKAAVSSQDASAASAGLGSVGAGG